jgi:TetR/AcrR family transcriptional regulator, transcriptional repressor for nem operon
MSDIKTAILDAAQRRIQLGGFGGFSFREIAADVGIKSSSVHYHFPAKEDLAAAVLRRWRENASAHIDAELEREPDPVRAWRHIIRGTVRSETHMCPCTVLAAAIQDLPDQVGNEVKGFFRMWEDKMIGQGLSRVEASKLLSTLIGAMVISNALGDSAHYDRATRDLAAPRKAA